MDPPIPPGITRGPRPRNVSCLAARGAYLPELSKHAPDVSHHCLARLPKCATASRPKEAILIPTRRGCPMTASRVTYELKRFFLVARNLLLRPCLAPISIPRTTCATTTPFSAPTGLAQLPTKHQQGDYGRISCFSMSTKNGRLEETIWL